MEGSKNAPGHAGSNPPYNLYPLALEKYSSFIRSRETQADLSNGKVPARLLAFCIERGLVDCNDKTILSELERSVGKPIRPLNPPQFDSAELARQLPRQSSTAGMPVVSSGTPPISDPSLSAPEMLRKSVAEMDARIAASEILKRKDFPESIKFNARKVWCSPALMRTLVRDPGYIDKLRAAMYPVLVSYCERRFEDGGRWYIVPYVTVLDNFTNDGKYAMKKGEHEDDFRYEGRYEESFTFFLNHKGTIGHMHANHIHLYDPADFASPEAVRRYMGELKATMEAEIKDCSAKDAKKEYREKLRDIMEYLEPYASGAQPIGYPEELMRKFAKFHKNAVLGCDTENEFVNAKTGGRFYATIRNDVKESRQYGDGWHKVIDVTECMVGERLDRSRLPGALERQYGASGAADRSAADAGLVRLVARMLKTEGLRDSGCWYHEVDGAAAYEAEVERAWERA